MLYLCISYECYISIIATLIGAAAVFVTVSPLIYDKRYKQLNKELEEQKKRVDYLVTALKEQIDKYERLQKYMREAMKNGKNNNSEN